MAETGSENACVRSITIDPPPDRWESLVQSHQSRQGARFLGRAAGEWSTLTRRELFGQETDDTVLSTGHQAEFWHPGILAKYLALGAFAAGRSGKSRLLELVVDQDAGDPLEWPAPFHIETRSPAEPDLKRRIIRVGHADPAGETTVRSNGRSDGMKPVVATIDLASVVDDPSNLYPESVRCGLSSMIRAMESAAAASHHLAEQVSIANAVLRDEIFGPPGVPKLILQASSLTDTTFWRAMIDDMRRDPERVAKLYNDALERSPDSGITPLDMVEGSVELPLWVIDSTTGHRRRAWSHDLDEPGVVLWPRALLMTGFKRAAVADLFVHGRGGGTYDRATEHWFRNWLGVELAPIAVVSADVHLEFGIEPATAHDVSDARWRLHHLKYNLDREAADDPTLRERKQEMLRKIDSLPRRSLERYNAYLELQKFQQNLRGRFASHLHDAELELAKRERALAERAVLEDRTWPFPFYDRATLAELNRRIRQQFNAESPVGSLEDSEPTESLCIGCCGDL